MSVTIYRKFNLLAIAALLSLSPQVFADTPEQAISEITTPIADTVITADIKTKIALDQSLSNFDVDVTTRHGVVYLVGHVNSEADATALIRLAQSSQGVKDVNAEKLAVKESRHPFDDMVITAKVEGVFIREKLFGDKPVAVGSITIETNNGVVFLTGTAHNQAQIDRAMTLARSVHGVKDVESRVEIAD